MSEAFGMGVLIFSVGIGYQFSAAIGAITFGAIFMIVGGIAIAMEMRKL